MMIDMHFVLVVSSCKIHARFKILHMQDVNRSCRILQDSFSWVCYFLSVFSTTDKIQALKL